MIKIVSGRIGETRYDCDDLGYWILCRTARRILKNGCDTKVRLGYGYFSPNMTCNFSKVTFLKTGAIQIGCTLLRKSTVQRLRRELGL